MGVIRPIQNCLSKEPASCRCLAEIKSTPKEDFSLISESNTEKHLEKKLGKILSYLKEQGQAVLKKKLLKCFFGGQ